MEMIYSKNLMYWENDKNAGVGLLFQWKYFHWF